jgi:hypothetical protein
MYEKAFSPSPRAVPMQRQAATKQAPASRLDRNLFIAMLQLLSENVG